MATVTHKVCVYHNSQFDYFSVSSPSETWDNDPVMTRITEVVEVEFPLLDDADTDRAKIESLIKFRKHVEQNYEAKVAEINAQIDAVGRGA